MTKQEIPVTFHHVKDQRSGLLTYFRHQRQRAVDRYRGAGMDWPLGIALRRDARAWALHYGRLVRKMEGRA